MFQESYSTKNLTKKEKYQERNLDNNYVNCFLSYHWLKFNITCNHCYIHDVTDIITDIGSRTCEAVWIVDRDPWEMFDDVTFSINISIAIVGQSD